MIEIPKLEEQIGQLQKLLVSEEKILEELVENSKGVSLCKMLLYCLKLTQNAITFCSFSRRAFPILGITYFPIASDMPIDIRKQGQGNIYLSLTAKCRLVACT